MIRNLKHVVHLINIGALLFSKEQELSVDRPTYE